MTTAPDLAAALDHERKRRNAAEAAAEQATSLSDYHAAYAKRLEERLAEVAGIVLSERDALRHWIADGGIVSVDLLEERADELHRAWLLAVQS